MVKNNKLKQPYLGIIGTAICIALSLAFCRLFDVMTFTTWVTLFLVSMIPAQIVIGLVWEAEFPPLTTGMKQPTKGLSLVILMILSGLVITPLSLYLIGGGIAPPTPYVVMYIILTVVVTFWLVVIMQCWPLTAISKSPLVTGIGVWLLSYFVSYLFFILFFDYSFLKGTPLYIEYLDPQGMFNAWSVLSFALTSMVFMLALVLLDFLPITFITKKISVLGTQPVFGIFTTILIMCATLFTWNVFVRWLGMDPVVYMVQIPASMIFGQFIMLVMLKTSPLQSMRQPIKGFTLLLISTVLAVLLYAFYNMVSTFIVGPLQGGGPEYQLDLWLASAMLAVTFPLLIIYADFFQFWPIAKVENTQR